MNDKLYIACVAFFTIDLMLVGTTCLAVLLLVRKIIMGKVEIKIADKKIRIDRPFIEKG